MPPKKKNTLKAVPDDGLTAKDIADLEALDTELPQFHTVLEVWREVLKPAKDEATYPPTPAWSNRIISAYHGIEFKDMIAFRDSYFAKVDELFNILLLEISYDNDCLSWPTPEEDAENNAVHYKNLLLQWQMAVQQWELDWECTSPTAAVELAAISEVHKMFFGQTGLTAFLDNIKFEFTEDDQTEMAEALIEQRGER